jgi:hypothetical protein
MSESSPEAAICPFSAHGLPTVEPGAPPLALGRFTDEQLDESLSLVVCSRLAGELKCGLTGAMVKGHIAVQGPNVRAPDKVNPAVHRRIAAKFLTSRVLPDCDVHHLLTEILQSEDTSSG